MFVTIRACGYLVENRYFAVPDEARKFVEFNTEEARKNGWDISYAIDVRADKRTYVKPEKKGKKSGKN